MAQLDSKLKKALEQRLQEWSEWAAAGTGWTTGGGSVLAALMASGGELIRSTAPTTGYRCPRAEEVNRCMDALEVMLPSARRVLVLELRAGEAGLETQIGRARAAKMSRRQYCEYLNTGRWILVGMLYGKASAAAFKAAAFEQPEPRRPRVQTWHADRPNRNPYPENDRT